MMLLSEKYTTVNAIDPTTGELTTAVLVKDHFGKGKSAINFGRLNSPYHLADDILWEVLD